MSDRLPDEIDTLLGDFTRASMNYRTTGQSPERERYDTARAALVSAILVYGREARAAGRDVLMSEVRSLNKRATELRREQRHDLAEHRERQADDLQRMAERLRSLAPTGDAANRCGACAAEPGSACPLCAATLRAEVERLTRERDEARGHRRRVATLEGRLARVLDIMNDVNDRIPGIIGHGLPRGRVWSRSRREGGKP